MKSQTYYLHTLDGQPAFFDGEMICFAPKGTGRCAVLCASLGQIRREHQASRDYRIANNLSDEWHYAYGYVRVRVPGASQ